MFPTTNWSDDAISESKTNVCLVGILFVFVDVTLDPNNLAQPAIVTDSILFNTNGNIQDVDLAAFGWDADFTFPSAFIEGIGSIHFLDCDITWTAAEPHVIYGWAVVPEGCTLTIEAGANVYRDVSVRSSGTGSVAWSRARLMR